VRRTSGLRTAAAPVIGANGVVNALSYTGGTVAPGEVISIFGSGFGAGGTNIPVNNSYPMTLGRAKVLIGEIAAPVLAATPTQINAVVPYGLGPTSPSVSVAVQVDDVLSAPLTIPLAAAAPGLATADASGTGEAAILNQDGTVNSSANPASRGSYISLFGTGAGLASPSIVAGTLILATPYPLPQNAVAVTIGGQPATVQYAGAAPTLPSGMLQINVLVPANIQAGNAAVAVTVGTLQSSQVVTVAIR
jgi:trimeric autotransporter adhesin